MEDKYKETLSQFPQPLQSRCKGSQHLCAEKLLLWASHCICRVANSHPSAAVILRSSPSLNDPPQLEAPYFAPLLLIAIAVICALLEGHSVCPPDPIRTHENSLGAD